MDERISSTEQKRCMLKLSSLVWTDPTQINLHVPCLVKITNLHKTVLASVQVNWVIMSQEKKLSVTITKMETECRWTSKTNVL